LVLGGENVLFNFNAIGFFFYIRYRNKTDEQKWGRETLPRIPVASDPEVKIPGISLQAVRVYK
jgi:hypothetical protein